MDAEWKMPPLVKVYEALGALGDGRVRLEDARSAAVCSSGGEKTYRVELGEDRRTIASNDNASYWQGYLGYPAIATLIARGILSAPRTACEALAGIPWREINRRARGDYARTIAQAERCAIARGADCAVLRREAEAILAALSTLAPLRGPRLRPPRPKRGGR